MLLQGGSDRTIQPTAVCGMATGQFLFTEQQGDFLFSDAALPIMTFNESATI